MIKRCYSGTDKAYIGITVCADWKYFSNYKIWYDAQDKPDCEFQVDKDLLQGNSRVYSPDTCIVLPTRINQFLSVPSKGLPGAYFEKSRNKYQAYCSDINGKRIGLGRHKTENEAHRAWQKEKINQILKLNEWYTEKSYCNKAVVDKLSLIALKVQNDYLSGNPTLNLKLEY